MIRQLLALSLLLAAAPLSAQQGDRTERVKFARGTASKVIKGELRGQAGVTYVVGARARQLMTVTATTGNHSTFFDIIDPGGGEPLFNGFELGDRFSFEVPKSGDYRVRMYRTGKVIRRNEIARYTLTIGIQ
jgi:hypothetical protein